jgi:hypothetical protein
VGPFEIRDSYFLDLSAKLKSASGGGPCMADSKECRRQSTECSRLAGTDVSDQLKTLLRSMSRNWIALANQMDRVEELDKAIVITLGVRR